MRSNRGRGKGGAVLRGCDTGARGVGCVTGLGWGGC